jgi:hypothetical protein
MCRLVMGNKSLALSEISQACGLCQQQPRLLLAHRPQLHTLLGLYAMSMNCMEAAEAQFTAALRVRSLCEASSSVSQDTHCISIRKTHHLVWFRAIIAVYCENHAECVNTLCGQKQRYFGVEAGDTRSYHCALKG